MGSEPTTSAPLPVLEMTVVPVPSPALQLPPALAPLPTAPSGHAPQVRQARKYLEAAHGSTSALLESLAIVRKQKKVATGETRGRYSNDEIELLRAALVFTSSGLDASLQRLCRDALPALIRRPDSGARARYQEFLKHELSAPKPSEPFRDAVLAADPEAELINFYVKERTKASYQGSRELRTRVREALGIGRSSVPDPDLAALDPFFEARNAIVHGMDYVDPESSLGRKRHHRTRDSTVGECDLVFALAARFIAETAKSLRRK